MIIQSDKKLTMSEVVGKSPVDVTNLLDKNPRDTRRFCEANPKHTGGHVQFMLKTAEEKAAILARNPTHTVNLLLAKDPRDASILLTNNPRHTNTLIGKLKLRERVRAAYFELK